MTEETIKETLNAIRKTTARVTKSKATAIKFLVDLGLIEEEKPSKKTMTKRK
jgi:hypothetical protein